MDTPTTSDFAVTDDSKVYFATLPTELMGMVAAHLEPTDLLKLRLILPKSHHALLPKLLNHITKRLYVEPREKSLDNFAKICASPFFQSQVEEVVFVAKAIPTYARQDREEWSNTIMRNVASEVDSDDWNSLAPDYVRLLPSICPELIDQAWNIYDNLVHELASCVHSIDTYDVESQRHSYEPSTTLSDGLGQLPKLVKVAIQGSIKAEGLNATAFWYSPDYATGRIGRRPHTRSSEDAGRLAAHTIVGDYGVIAAFQGLDAILEAISYTSISLRQLELGDCLTDGLPIDHQSWNVVECKITKAVASKVTDLTVAYRCARWLFNSEIGPMWKTLFSAAVSVRTLRIYVDRPLVHPGWEDRPQYSVGASVLEQALQHSEIPTLQHFEIIGHKGMPGVVDATLLNGFIQRHEPTLKVVKMSGILFSDGQIGETLAWFLKARRQSTWRGKFTMKVHRRE